MGFSTLLYLEVEAISKWKFPFFSSKIKLTISLMKKKPHFFSESFLGERSEVFLCFSSVGEKMEKKKTRRLILTITPCSIDWWPILIGKVLLFFLLLYQDLLLGRPRLKERSGFQGVKENRVA